MAVFARQGIDPIPRRICPISAIFVGQMLSHSECVCETAPLAFDRVSSSDWIIVCSLIEGNNICECADRWMYIVALSV